MKIVVDSLTGMGLAFANKLGESVLKIDDVLEEECILVTRNVGLGKIPPTSSAFLDRQSGLVKGVVVNGMKRFGPFYCKAADKIHAQYGIEIIAKIETEGNEEDVAKVKAFLKKLG